MLVLAEPLLKRVWTKLRHNNFLDEDVLVLCALLMGIASGVYVETCLAVILYQVAGPILTKVLERSLHKIDQAVDVYKRQVLE